MAFRPYSAAVTPGPGVWPHPGCQPGRAEVAPWGGGLHAVVPTVPAGVSGPPEPQASPPVLQGESGPVVSLPSAFGGGGGSLFFLSL